VRYAHAPGLVRQPIMDDAIGGLIRVAIYKTRRRRVKGDEASIGADRCSSHASHEPAVAISLTSSARHTHPLGRARQPIMDEDVDHPVCVAWHKIVRE